MMIPIKPLVIWHRRRDHRRQLVSLAVEGADWPLYILERILGETSWYIRLVRPGNDPHPVSRIEGSLRAAYEAADQNRMDLARRYIEKLGETGSIEFKRWRPTGIEYDIPYPAPTVPIIITDERDGTK